MHNTDRLHVVAALTYVQSEIINPNQKNNRLQPLLVTRFFKGVSGESSCCVFLTKHWERRHSSQNDQYVGP